MKERLRKEVHKQKQVLIIDYSDSKEAGMIEIITAAKELILKENKKVLILSIFNHKNYVSPRFMRHAEKQIRDAEHLISKNAITGISDIQRWMVKGINLWYKDQLYPFDSVDKGVGFPRFLIRSQFKAVEPHQTFLRLEGRDRPRGAHSLFF